MLLHGLLTVDGQEGCSSRGCPGRPGATRGSAAFPSVEIEGAEGRSPCFDPAILIGLACFCPWRRNRRRRQARPAL